MTRRDTLRLIATGAAAAATPEVLAAPAGPAAAAGPGASGPQATAASRMPAIFLAHGAPPLLDIPQWVSELHAWAGALPRPRAVLMISAHWEERPVTIGATTPQPLIYDFYGFPQKYYRVQYPAPGAPALAARVKALLAPLGPLAEDPRRGLDHGAYVPLVAMYPAADVPVLQVSLPSLDPKALVAFGQALAPLRDEGVLIIGSGFLTHNLGQVDWSGELPPAGWAVEFDAWVADALRRRDVDALCDFMRKGPGARIALPTTEHFVPLLVAMGAAAGEARPPTSPISGFWLGTLTRRSVQFG